MNKYSVLYSFFLNNLSFFLFIQDFAFREIDFDEVIKNPFSFATKCCRSIKFSNVKTIIDQYVEGTNNILSPIFSFSLESLPYTDCLISLNATSKNIKFIPSNEFLFSNTTQSLTKSFQIQSSFS